MSKPDYVYVTYISTTPEKLWAALMDGEMTKQYWGVKRNVSDWKVGSQWEHQDYDDARDVAITGEVLESDPPKKLVLTWGQPGVKDKEKISQVTFELQPFFDAVKLTVTHDHLDEAMLNGISEGWPAILSSLKTMLETGHAMPMTMRRWGRPVA